MKKRGFTLIELLAVIVILAIIALIATPLVLNTIDNARSGAAKSSATTYIKEVEKQVVVSEMSSSKIKDGTYYVGELTSVEVKGDKPSGGQVVIENGEVKEARLCINNYSIDYDGKNTELSNNSYCGGEVTLNFGEEKLIKDVSETVEFDITGKDISGITNIVCNNGSKVEVEENKVIVSNVLGDTTCTMNESLKTTVSNLDNSASYIVMMSDESLTSSINFPKETDTVITLNSHQLTLNGKMFRAYGNLVVNGDEDSKIISTGQALNNSGLGTVTINGGYYERNSGTGAAIYNEGSGTIVINSGAFYNTGSGVNVQNNLQDNNTNGTIIINGGYFESSIGATIYNNSKGTVNINGGNFIAQTNTAVRNAAEGTINVNQSETPIYISSKAVAEWKPAITNNLTGTINIIGNIANECTNDSTQTTSGLCVYAEGDKNYSNDTANASVANVGDGIININGGTYFGGYMGVSNNFNGSINIKNGNISSGWYAIANMRTATTNICDANISSLKYDIWSTTNTTTGTINYSNSVVFTDGTNNPVTGGITENIIPNYSGTCN